MNSLALDLYPMALLEPILPEKPLCLTKRAARRFRGKIRAIKSGLIPPMGYCLSNSRWVAPDFVVHPEMKPGKYYICDRFGFLEDFE